ncbi:unnamed protein product [Lupinus luteus]|uniref:DUF4283 domain-containing protein n=1 Tax=Lupinus luteus TaxID=3873 RepID=A0AAV1VS56_LUPLU
MEPLLFKGVVDMEVSRKNLMVGEVRTWEDALSIKKTFVYEGIVSVNPIPMGGNHILIKGEPEVDCSQIINMDLDCCRAIFHSISPWSPSSKAVQKTVWVKCWGVPILAWSVDFFQFLASSFGVFLKVDDATLNMERVDFGHVLLTTSVLSFINKIQKVVVGGREFDIALVEEDSPTFPNNVDRRGSWLEEGSDFVDSEDGEWWPEDGEVNEVVSFSVEEEEEDASMDKTRSRG